MMLYILTFLEFDRDEANEIRSIRDADVIGVFTSLRVAKRAAQTFHFSYPYPDGKGVWTGIWGEGVATFSNDVVTYDLYTEDGDGGRMHRYEIMEAEPNEILPDL